MSFKELKIHRNGLGEFVLNGYQKDDGRLVLKYSCDEGLELEVEDAIWFLSDRTNGCADHILVVKGKKGPGEAIVERSDGEKEMRELKLQEKFTLIATYREVDVNSKVN